LLCGDGISGENPVKIRAITREFLRERKKALLEEIMIRDEELALIERGLPLEGTAEEEEAVLTEQIASLIQKPNGLGVTENERQPLDLSGLVTKYSQTVTAVNSGGSIVKPLQQRRLKDEEDIITVPQTREILNKKGITIVDKLIPIARINREGDISKRLIYSIVSFLEDNHLLDVKVVKERIGSELSQDGAINILSCTRHLGIRDLVPLVNPYYRLHHVFYIIGNDVSLDNILPQLICIRDSLGEGNYSYYRISEFLINNRRMPANHELFDPVIDTAFVIREDGTYVKEFFGPFEKRTRGYRFMHIKNLFSFEEGLAEKALEQLAKYDGELVIPIDVSGAPSLRPESPTVIYMFKCDEKGYVDLDLLKRELGLNT